MKKLPGFTLVETLVAIGVLTLAISIPFYSVGKALLASYVARDQLTASALGAEGIEFVRAVRDSNYIYNYKNGTSIGWMGGLDGTVGSGAFGTNPADCFNNSCVVDTQSFTVSQCTAANCSDKPLYLNPYGTTGFSYAQASNGNGTLTRFSRALKLTQINATEVLATVTVTWVTNGVTYHIVTTEYFDNWLS